MEVGVTERAKGAIASVLAGLAALYGGVRLIIDNAGGAIEFLQVLGLVIAAVAGILFRDAYRLVRPGRNPPTE